MIFLTASLLLLVWRLLFVEVKFAFQVWLMSQDESFSVDCNKSRTQL